LIEVIQAGLVPYREALEWQRALAHDRLEGRLDHDLLLLVEHPPVITLGRGSRPEHVVHPEGIDVVEIERGGDVTFHGPGQLVGYPILDLGGHRRDLHWYLRALEEAFIVALAALGVRAERRPPYTGVWVGGENAGRAPRKIASMGVHVKHWVTWHGFALNVTTDLDYFRRIVPCGIDGVEMTSLERELREAGRDLPDDDAVVRAVVRGFEEVFTPAKSS
jgi:lipoyl(octanoyl) transferase